MLQVVTIGPDDNHLLKNDMLDTSSSNKPIAKNALSLSGLKNHSLISSTPDFFDSLYPIMGNVLEYTTIGAFSYVGGVTF